MLNKVGPAYKVGIPEAIFCKLRLSLFILMRCFLLSKYE